MIYLRNPAFEIGLDCAKKICSHSPALPVTLLTLRHVGSVLPTSFYNMRHGLALSWATSSYSLHIVLALPLLDPWTLLVVHPTASLSAFFSLSCFQALFWFLPSVSLTWYKLQFLYVQSCISYSIRSPWQVACSLPYLLFENFEWHQTASPLPLFVSNLTPAFSCFFVFFFCSGKYMHLPVVASSTSGSLIDTVSGPVVDQYVYLLVYACGVPGQEYHANRKFRIPRSTLRY